jgi:CBS domain-containing protein
MQAKEIMTKSPECCTRDTNLQEVARKMADQDCGQIPVIDNWDNESLVGVVTDRDIICRVLAKGRNSLEMTAGVCMSSPVVSVTGEESLEECCSLMEENQVRRLPVVDEHGRCCGIVSLADIARHAPNQPETARVVTAVSQRTETALQSVL